jgi:dTDP-glucose 4,6-dehydratase
VLSLLVTGGAGFIGANFIRRQRGPVVVLDAFTYAGHRESLAGTGATIVSGDVADPIVVENVFRDHEIDRVVHLAAETHVDRSILDGAAFARTNVVGTAVLLEAARRARVRRFLHVSTDEVYGELAPDAAPFTEDAPLRPRSPYAASKAGAEHLVASAVHTHGLPAIVVRPSNAFGPYQLPEKLIPLMIERAAAGEPLPVYGDGLQRREWIHAGDLCAALELLLEQGVPGETYNAGGGEERVNLDVVRGILARLGRPESLVQHVRDRPSHDRRYALSSAKLRALGWRPRADFPARLAETVDWYLANVAWRQAVRGPDTERFMAQNYGGR